MPKPTIATLAVVLLFTACPERPVDPTYKGEPLAVVQGQLILPAAKASPQNLRLALLWTGEYLGSGAPLLIETQDVTFEGSFPASFKLNLYGPPPKGALITLSTDPTKHFSYAYLIAYEDRNNNGTLDTIKTPVPGQPDTTVHDKVLGGSAAFFDLSQVGATFLQYQDYESGEFPKGFSLAKSELDGEGVFRTRVLPVSTPLSIELTGEAELDAVLCEADIAAGALETANPMEACGLKATPHRLRVSAFIDRTYDDSVTGPQDRISAWVSDGEKWVSDATVTLNGAALTRSDDEGQYVGTGAVVVGDNDLRISAPGLEAIGFHTLLPAQERFLTPAAGATFKSGSSIAITWPAARSTNFRSVRVERKEPLYAPLLFSAYVDGTSVTTSPIAFEGPAQIVMKAMGAGASDRVGSLFLGTVIVKRPVQLVP